MMALLDFEPAVRYAQGMINDALAILVGVAITTLVGYALWLITGQVV